MKTGAEVAVSKMQTLEHLPPGLFHATMELDESAAKVE
jgi:hypothetical protein